MALREDVANAVGRWQALTFYGQFEHAVILILTGLIAVVILASVWTLTLTILFDLVLSDGFDPTDHIVFQDIFGRIFTVIIALEFKRSLLVVTERRDTVVHVRAVILIAMLAIVRKLIILDLTETEALQVFGLAAAILALAASIGLSGSRTIGSTRTRVQETGHSG